jgi:adenosylmethionine---8-amino-7-oxononanoate aminotransferase
MTLSERDRQVIWHPFTPQKNMPSPIAITRGEGVYLVDENGQRYIDAISSWWVTIHGHAHPYIAEKLYAQAKTLEQVIFAGFTHEPAVQLAERLLPLLPGSFARIFYSDNGSTATEVAIKMALQYWWNQQPTTTTPGRHRILALNNAYHGDTFGAMSISDRGVFTLAFHDKLFEVVFIDPPMNDNLHIPDPDTIACFIYEPLVQGAGCMNMYPPAALNALLEKCKEHNIICIADEVMTGFGRSGKLFASEYCETKPDIICLSKGLTGGTMALGVTACAQFIYDAFVQDDKLKTFFHGHSFTANPLACTAALASLDLLGKDSCQQSMQMIAEENNRFLQQLKTGASTNQKTKNHRTLGTLLAFELQRGNDEYLNNISQAVTESAMKKGVYLRPLGNTVYIMPPYCITKDELQMVHAVMEEVVRDV